MDMSIKIDVNDITVLYNRIKHRNRPSEKTLSINYLI